MNQAPEIHNLSSETDLINDRIRYLNEQTDFASTLFEGLIGYAIMAADFDGNIIAYNEGARHIYGYTPEEIIGQKNIEIFFPRDLMDAGKFQDIIDELIGKERFRHEGEMLKKDGGRFPARALFTLTRDKKGQVVGFIEIVEDLTEQKRAREAKQQAQANRERVEQLERELGLLEQLSKSAQTTVQLHGRGPSQERSPTNLDQLVNDYADLLDKALEQRAYKVEHNISEKLRSMGEKMAFIKAGPRDVVKIHATALKRKTGRAVISQKARAYLEEGRLMVLELMGHLASFYRKQGSALDI